jgi:hypothetical protein
VNLARLRVGVKEARSRLAIVRHGAKLWMSMVKALGIDFSTKRWAKASERSQDALGSHIYRWEALLSPIQVEFERKAVAAIPTRFPWFKHAQDSISWQKHAHRLLKLPPFDPMLNSISISQI